MVNLRTLKWQNNSVKTTTTHKNENTNKQAKKPWTTPQIDGDNTEAGHDEDDNDVHLHGTSSHAWMPSAFKDIFTSFLSQSSHAWMPSAFKDIFTSFLSQCCMQKIHSSALENGPNKQI